ncbi:MAG: phosphotransferase [Bacteroidetes bacterium]|nr:phosphotransferase [Bacteroidota bacterium]
MTKTNPSPEEIAGLLFTEHFGNSPLSISSLPVSGSDRRYYRLTGPKGKSAIATINTNIAENNTYFYFTELLRKHGINVPEMYRVAKDRRAYLQQDVGQQSLFDLLRAEGQTDHVKQLYKASLEQLAKLQWIAGRDTDFNQCFATRQFNEEAIMADLLYFKYYFADLQRVHYDRLALMDEMQQWSRELGRMQPLTLMYRDFQSRNIMVQHGKVWFIDFQGAMQGPPQYDIASLLWQAKAMLPAAWKEELLTSYISSVNELPTPRVEEIYFRKGYAQLVLLRLLQVLGAYGFRGLLERKPHFLSSIAPALESLSSFLADHPQLPAYPELRSLLEKLCSPQMQQRYTVPAPKGDSKLVVSICSFSYKKGIPKDRNENGGGYVFDCRGLLNPGRYAAYKYLSGFDTPVQKFLEQETKMPEFLNHVSALVSMHVEDFLARGFENLSVAFGCTGGQHRSVYAAEKLADYLRQRYQVEVSITHLNQDSWLSSSSDSTA